MKIVFLLVVASVLASSLEALSVRGSLGNQQATVSGAKDAAKGLSKSNVMAASAPLADTTTTKLETAGKIAQEFVEQGKGVSKEVATEAIEFLKPYKEDLGALWDQVKEAIKDIVQKKD